MTREVSALSSCFLGPGLPRAPGRAEPGNSRGEGDTSALGMSVPLGWPGTLESQVMYSDLVPRVVLILEEEGTGGLRLDAWRADGVNQCSV